MSIGSTRPRLVPLLLATVLGLTGPAAANETLSSIARGGRLYDGWFNEIGEAPPVASHPSYPTGHEFRPERFWRCVECHGWDYKGKDGALAEGDLRTGIKGIDGMKDAEPAKIVEILRDARHGYGDYLNETDLSDLANFVALGQIDMSTVIDPQTRQAKGDKDAGTVLYQTICANCHGNDGQQLIDAPPLGDFARENPWHSLHSIMNGHPNGSMPPLRALDMRKLVDALAYIQTLTTREPMSSVLRGGRLYDNWYKESGRQVPAGLHPAYPVGKASVIEARSTWRCKECHGYDYKGKDGTYAEGPHRTGIPGVMGWSGATQKSIMAVLKDQTHRFGGLMPERDLLDIANFLSRGLIDMDLAIDRATKRINGDAHKYEAHFQTICATCHGKDGTTVRTMPPLGRVATEDPWRSLHNLLNGHPGDPMPALRALDAEILNGILAFTQTLPTRR
ncbi:MAG: c-type cytochrome [Alphaproteobacteria bacterium]|nr:c-type cytochrome [Alphaproteobacteria bacterium]